MRYRIIHTSPHVWQIECFNPLTNTTNRTHVGYMSLDEANAALDEWIELMKFKPVVVREVVIED